MHYIRMEKTKTNIIKVESKLCKISNCNIKNVLWLYGPMDDLTSCGPNFCCCIAAVCGLSVCVQCVVATDKIAIS